MNDHLKRAAKFFLLVAAVPFLISFIGAWVMDFGFLLFIVGMPALFITLLIGGVMLTLRGFKLAHKESPLADRVVVSMAAPMMLVATIFGSWTLFGAGRFAGDWTRLMVNRGHYDAIVEKERHGERSPIGLSGFREDDGVLYDIDQGPPLRVAFNPEGILDNWSGIVFDPTHDVMLMDETDPGTGRSAAPVKWSNCLGATSSGVGIYGPTILLVHSREQCPKPDIAART